MPLRACCFTRAAPGPGFVAASFLCLLLGIRKRLLLPGNIPLLRRPGGNVSRETILSEEKTSNALISRLASCETQIRLCLGRSIPDRCRGICLPRWGGKRNTSARSLTTRFALSRLPLLGRVMNPPFCEAPFAFSKRNGRYVGKAEGRAGNNAGGEAIPAASWHREAPRLSRGGRAGCARRLSHELPGWPRSDEDALGRHSPGPELLPARGRVPRDFPPLKKVLTVKILNVPVTKLNSALHF